jgi:hypothetical protein
MRFTSVILFLFCIHVSMAIINGAVGSSGVYPILQSQGQPKSDWFTTATTEVDTGSYFQNTVQSTGTTVELGFGDLARGIAKFFIVFGIGLVAVPTTMTGFGMESWLAVLFSLPIYAIYVMAIVQLIMNRQFKGME